MKTARPPRSVVRLALPCESHSFRDIRHALTGFLDPLPFDEDQKCLMVLAVDEACANVLRHAYLGVPGRPVRLRFESNRRLLRIQIRDLGKSCPARAIRGRKLEDFRPGGLGVHLIRRAFDRVSYAPQKRGTLLTLEKSLP